MKSVALKGKVHVDRLAELAGALSDPTRLRLLSLILHNPDICVCDLESVTEIPQSKISKHLAVLRRAELVSQRREGTWMHYSLVPTNSVVQNGLLDVVRSAHKTIPELKQDLAELKASNCLSPVSRPVQISV